MAARSFYSANYDEEIGFEIACVRAKTVRTAGAIIPPGSLWSIRKEGVVIGGFSMSLAGDVPLGAGLSSSASVEVATAMALLSHADVELPLGEGRDCFAGGPRMSMLERRAALWISLRLPGCVAESGDDAGLPFARI